MPRFFPKLILLFITSSLLLTGCRDKCGSEIDYDVDQDQLAADIVLIDAYLAENNIDAETHPSGIRYVIKRAGNGSRPSVCDNVTVTYEGKVMSNGFAFDSRVNPSNLGDLDDLITGWQIGIPLIKDGSGDKTGRITLYIPSVYAYGVNGNSLSGIPSNANLEFEIVLFNVR